MAAARVVRTVVVIAEPGVRHGWGAASVLAEAAGLAAVSVGDLCREQAQRGTPQGREISRYLDAGELVPDEVIGGLVADTLTNLDTGWVLLGYPRTVRQAELLTEQGHQPDAVVDLVLDDERFNSAWGYYRTRVPVRTAPGSGDFDEVAARLVAAVLPNFTQPGVGQRTQKSCGNASMSDADCSR